MGPLVRMFGKTPRVCLLEALMEMGTEEFTRGELADRQGLHRKNVNRVFGMLVKDGLVEQVSKDRRPTFRVREGSLRFHLLSQFESALSLAERSRLDDAYSEAGVRFTAAFGLALHATLTAESDDAAESPSRDAGSAAKDGTRDK